MTSKEIDEFRVQFKRVVYKRGLITTSAQRLKQLHSWDKNGSHENAIIKELEKLDILKNDYKIMLKGKKYEDWQIFSKRISVLTLRLKNAISSTEKAHEEISKLQF